MLESNPWSCESVREWIGGIGKRGKERIEWDGVGKD